MKVELRISGAPWYSSLGSMGQGLIISEADGRTVAVAYDEGDAPLIAAAPELLYNLQFLLDAARTEPGMSIYKAHMDRARAAIAKAKGATA